MVSIVGITELEHLLMTSILGYILVALYFVMEGLGRVGRGAKSLEMGPADYLGTILVLLGAALAVTNWISLAIVATAMLTAYHYRIQAEERMLSIAKGTEFARYRAQTWRLIPFLY